MQQTYPFKIRYWYDHMMPRDVEVWERFVAAWPETYDTVQYDVKVGSIPDFVANAEDIGQRAQAPLYQRKIDVVAYKGDQLDIIEVKPEATMATIGQVLGYKMLYIRDFTPPVEPKAIIVTGKADADMISVAAMQGVTVVVV